MSGANLDPQARIAALRGQRDKAICEHEDTLAMLEIYKQAVEQLQARVQTLESEIAGRGEGEIEHPDQVKDLDGQVAAEAS